MMNEHIQQLIDALRSGTYTQYFGQLRKGDCYCVIGVAADVVDPGSWQLLPGPWGSYPYNGTTGSVPENVPGYYGLSEGFLYDLMQLNDVDRYSFPQLADVIEKAVADGTAFKEES